MKKEKRKLICQPKIEVPGRLKYWSFYFSLSIAAILLRVSFDKKDIKALKAVQGPALVLGTHLSAIDFAYMLKMMPGRRLAFLISANMYYDRRVSWLFKFLGFLIPKRQFTADFEAIKAVKGFIDKGVSVGIYPEGRVSLDGTEGEIGMSTAKLVKWLGVPVVFVHGNGSYLKRPRYANKMHKGKVRVNARLLFTAEETKELSKEEILLRLRENFTYNEQEYQEKHHISSQAKSKKFPIAYGLDRLLYKCPLCGAEFSNVTGKDTLTCNLCGNGARIDKYGSITPVGEKSKVFPRIDLWYDWQYGELQKEVAASDYVISEEVDLQINNDEFAEFKTVERAVLTLDREGYHFAGEKYKLDFSVSQSGGIALMLGFHIDFFENDTIYRFAFAKSGMPAKFSVATELIHNKYYRDK